MRRISFPDWQPARQAAILVGGKGTRLGALAKNSPKPLMPIDGDTVFLDDVIFNFARQGFTEILLLAGHMADQVQERYHGKTICGAEMRVVAEAEPAGTAGALLNAADFLHETFVLANGDSFFDVNVRPLDEALMSAPDAVGIMALRHVDNADRYGKVELQNGYVRKFREKDLTTPVAEGLINAGIGLFRKQLLSYIVTSPLSIETDIYPRLATEGKLLGHQFWGYFIDIGLPETLTQARVDIPLRRRRPALFLDRDGVINKDNGYTHRVEDLQFIDGAVDMIRRANDESLFVVVITNQAGVAHGYYDLSDVYAFHAAIQRELAAAGAHIDAFYICPFHPEAKIAAYHHPDHPERKPNPGMIRRALREWPIIAERSMLIGDRPTDIEAARRAGIEGVLFDGADLKLIANEAMDHIKSSFDHRKN